MTAEPIKAAGEAVQAASETGMLAALWARLQPTKVAVIDPDGRTRSFADVNRNANRIARLLRAAGLKPGDGIALLCTNRAEFVEVLAAANRTGLRLTPVNWHLTSEEIAYIVDDCEAKALFADARVDAAWPAAEQCAKLRLKVAIGGVIEGFAPYDASLALLSGEDIGEPSLGTLMPYTSGTTGRPKGIFRPNPIPLTPATFAARGYDSASVQLCAGPAYHAAPLTFDVRAAMTTGAPLVFIDKWDSELVLRTIAEKKVTHLHLVPIMFQRLLALPREVVARYDISHVRYIVHGAAPCPPEVKLAMIEWFGPVLNEYYAGSEGGAGFFITSEEWLRKPGSVGRRPTTLRAMALDEHGQECPPGVPGKIYHELPAGGAFTYFKDDAKTDSNRVGDFFTLGDIGFFDEDDYLFLTGRDAEVIISGGVNIYPQEIDNELIKHEAVADAATVGVPDDSWGEQVRAVVVLKPGRLPSDALAQEILAFARANLPSFKAPKQVDFVTELPRSEAGKVQRNKVRAPYWQGRSRQI